MRKVTAGVVAAAVGLVSVAPASAMDVEVGVDGIRIGPREHDPSMSGISMSAPITAIEPTAER